MRGGRNAILNAAMKLFARKGYAGASTREICQAAGITKPVLYYHFRSKEHLYQELMIDCFNHYQKTMLRASKVRGSLRSRLLSILDNDFRETRKDPVRFEMILRMVFAPAEQLPYFNVVEVMEKERELIAGVFRDGIEAGEAHGDPQRLATAFIGISFIASLENLFTGRKTLTRSSAEKYIDVMLHGCGKAAQLYRPV